MKKSLLGLTFASLMFSAGSAVAADYKIDKEGQHAFVNFRIQHLGYSWLYGTFKAVSYTHLTLPTRVAV
ncbi:hypothetical protein KQJ25_27215 [Escherichia sp. S69_ASV_4]|nr:hypothetical protein [Escherichia sp. S69_ASV_4]